MKTKYFITLAVCFLLSLSLKLTAQCDKELLWKVGNSYEETGYDAKDKKTDRTVHEIKEVKKTASGAEALIHFTAYDSKDNKAAEGDFSIICEGGILKFDISSMMNQNQMKLPENIEMQVEKAYIESPSELSVGQQLKDAVIKMKMVDKTSQAVLGTTTVSIINRKVEGKQSVTTPAGTFETFKVTATMKIETALSGGMTMPAMEMKTVEFRNKEVGTVRSEIYKTDGKLDKYRLLTKATRQ